MARGMSTSMPLAAMGAIMEMLLADARAAVAAVERCLGLGGLLSGVEVVETEVWDGVGLEWLSPWCPYLSFSRSRRRCSWRYSPTGLVTMPVIESAMSTAVAMTAEAPPDMGSHRVTWMVIGFVW
jgi:hypothetical protein